MRSRTPAYGLAIPYDQTAAQTITRQQAMVAVACLAVLAVVAVIQPLATAIGLIAVATLAYMAAFVYRMTAFWLSMRRPEIVSVSDEEARAFPDEWLPVYTVLVPAYREPSVIAALIARLTELEYPPDKLDIRLLLEEEDTETIAAALATNPGPQFTIVRVPDSQPKTKPKACNYALSAARGELVTIYDAEDRPEPLQLRRAVVAFERLDESVACLQAKLSYYNADQNMLTRWFTIEYGMWFSNLLPGLVAQRGPLPLGGTSNHFRNDILREVGGWDPYNVTEDADLGIRLARRGYKTRVLDSVTLEEANSDVINWVKQRSRWYKGYLQTWLVHIRRPRQLLRTIGFRSFLRFNLVLAGTPIIAVLNLLFWFITALWFLGQPAVVEAVFPWYIYFPALAALILGNGATLYMNLVALREDDRADLIIPALTVPAFFVMMSVAAAKGTYQLIRNPSYWEKTFHGLSQKPDAGPTGS